MLPRASDGVTTPQTAAQTRIPANLPRDSAQTLGPAKEVAGVIPGADPFVGASFTLRNRIGRALWGIAYILLFRPSLRPMHAWRGFLLRLFGARLGRDVHVYPAAHIWAPWNLEIGDRVGIADGAILYNMAPLRIGNCATVSTGAHLCGGSHDIDSANFQLTAGPIEVGAYAWICTEAFVGQNVRIPEGAVIGARAVVMKSPPSAWTVYVGAPARPVRARAQDLKNPARGTMDERSGT